MKRSATRRSPSKPRRTPGWFRAAGWFALLLCSLLLVTWRQTRGLELETAIREIETDHELAAAERVEHEREIQRLSSRARVVQVARDRFGMRLAVGSEIVFLPAVAAAPSAPSLPAQHGDGSPLSARVAR